MGTRILAGHKILINQIDNYSILFRPRPPIVHSIAIVLPEPVQDTIVSENAVQNYCNRSLYNRYVVFDINHNIVIIKMYNISVIYLTFSKTLQ